MPILDSVKALLELTSVDFDSLLTDIIIPSVLQNADEYMDVVYTAEVVANEQYFDGGGSILYLDYVNLAEVELYEDGTLLAVGNDFDYVIYESEGIIKKVNETFIKGLKIVRAVYNGGYEEDAIPGALRQKLVKQCGHEFRRRKDPGLSSVTFPDGTIDKHSIDEWLKDVKNELNRRRRIYL